MCHDILSNAKPQAALCSDDELRTTAMIEFLRPIGPYFVNTSVVGLRPFEHLLKVWRQQSVFDKGSLQDLGRAWRLRS